MAHPKKITVTIELDRDVVAEVDDEELNELRGMDEDDTLDQITELIEDAGLGLVTATAVVTESWDGERESL